MFAGAGGFGDANQFAGGGFMPNSQNQFGTGSGAGTAKKNYENATLRSVTIRQLGLCMDGADDSVMLDGAELSNIKIVGKVANVVYGNTSWIITVHDGTGSAEIQHWVDATDWQLEHKKATLVAGQYVVVHGDVRTFKQRRSINAYSVRKVDDYNEITYHQLQVIHQHLRFTKGHTPEAVANANGVGGGFGAPVGGGGGSWGGGGGSVAKPYDGGVRAYAVGGGAGGGGGSGMPPCQEAVNQALLAFKTQGGGDRGMHFTEIASHLNGRWSVPEIKAACGALASDGLAYSTTDEDHWACT